jgi:hypothetical protein
MSPTGSCHAGGCASEQRFHQDEGTPDFAADAVFLVCSSYIEYWVNLIEA